MENSVSCVFASARESYVLVNSGPTQNSLQGLRRENAQEF